MKTPRQAESLDQARARLIAPRRREAALPVLGAAALAALSAVALAASVILGPPAWRTPRIAAPSSSRPEPQGLRAYSPERTFT
jgi:hypothetical protein